MKMNMDMDMDMDMKKGRVEVNEDLERIVEKIKRRVEEENAVWENAVNILYKTSERIKGKKFSIVITRGTLGGKIKEMIEIKNNGKIEVIEFLKGSYINITLPSCLNNLEEWVSSNPYHAKMGREIIVSIFQSPPGEYNIEIVEE